MSYNRYGQGQVSPWQNGGGLLPHPGAGGGGRMGGGGGGINPMALVTNLVGAMLSGQQQQMGMMGPQMRIGPQMGMGHQVSSSSSK